MRTNALAAPVIAAAIAATLTAPSTAAAAKRPCGLKGKGLKVVATSPTATVVERYKVTSPDLDPTYSTTIWGCIGNRKPRVIYQGTTRGPLVTLTGNQVGMRSYGYDSACLKAGFGDGEDCSTGRSVRLVDLTTGATLYANFTLTNDPLAIASTAKAPWPGSKATSKATATTHSGRPSPSSAAAPPPRPPSPPADRSPSTPSSSGPTATSNGGSSKAPTPRPPPADQPTDVQTRPQPAVSPLP